MNLAASRSSIIISRSRSKEFFGGEFGHAATMKVFNLITRNVVRTICSREQGRKEGPTLAVKFVKEDQQDQYNKFVAIFIECTNMAIRDKGKGTQERIGH